MNQCIMSYLSFARHFTIFFSSEMLPMCPKLSHTTAWVLKIGNIFKNICEKTGFHNLLTHKDHNFLFQVIQSYKQPNKSNYLR